MWTGDQDYSYTVYSLTSHAAHPPSLEECSCTLGYIHTMFTYKLQHCSQILHLTKCGHYLASQCCRMNKLLLVPRRTHKHTTQNSYSAVFPFPHNAAVQIQTDAETCWLLHSAEINQASVMVKWYSIKYVILCNSNVTCMIVHVLHTLQINVWRTSAFGHPTYLSSVLTPHQPQQTLCAVNHNLLSVPCCNSSFGKEVFLLRP